MSAEDEAIKYIQTINTEITETLDELKKKRKDSRELTKEEHLKLKEITDLLKKVRVNANKYIESFRVQTKLTDYN
jgi:F0F1-type ATP synthase membrane subunit b/b'|tara:strand:+ start:236 stop:460 length:225 start_codon:yes stop_codon:yes gene_type:complete